MTAVYPTTVKGFTTRVDYIDNVLAVHVNDLQDEVNAIEGIIGNLPQVGSGWIGTFDQVTTTWTNVKSRISNIEYGITSVLTKVLPAAGTTGQILQKTSNADYAVGWTTLASTIAITSVTGLGTGIATALQVNVGTAGAPVILNGAGGTPSSLTLTNATGLPESGVTNLTTDLAAKAPLASPTFTGTVTIPTGAAITSPTITGINLGFSTQATAASTKTLTVSSPRYQEFTGTTPSQVVQMPVTSTLTTSWDSFISNKSTQSIAVNSSGGNLIATVPAGTDWLFTCNAITGTTAASWSNSYAGASAVPAASSSFVGCSLYTTGVTTLANATQTSIAFQAESVDSSAFHDNTTNNSRITIPAGKGGNYLVTAKLSYESNATGIRQAIIYKNGTASIEYLVFQPATVNVSGATISRIVVLAAGDFIELAGYQTSGGNLNSESALAATQFGVQFLGA